MKGNKIQLTSRYEDVHTYVQNIDKTSAVIITDSQYIRCVFKKEEERSSPLDSIESIDFEGGPMLSVGNELNGRKIKSIKPCYLIQYENGISGN